MKINCAAIFLLSSLFACQDKTPADHKLFYGGTILTVDQDFTEVEAIVIKDEMIIATGSYDDLLETYGKQSEQIDLTGKVMLPGFIDAHAHAMTGSMVNYLNEDVGMTKFRTTEEVIAHLKEKAKNTPEGEWISARNWDPAVQDGPSELTIKELNSISTKHPVFIINASGHLAYANEMAFELAGIDKTVQNPPGAEFVKDEDGNLTGVMKNMVAFMQVFQANPASQTVDPGDALNSLLGQWNDVGITTSSDLAFGTATSSAKDADILFEAAKREDFTVRLRTYLMYSVAEEWDKTDYKPGSGNSLARIVGFKMVADGSNQGFTGLQREMYCCHSAHKKSFGLAYMTIDQLKHHALKRAEQGWQLAIHGNGDKGIDHLLYVLEELDSMGYDLKKLRPRIEHASILHDDQIAKNERVECFSKFSDRSCILLGSFYARFCFCGGESTAVSQSCFFRKRRHQLYITLGLSCNERKSIGDDRNCGKQKDLERT